MTRPTIIGLDASTLTRSARIACEEKGIEYNVSPGPLKQISDLRSPEFLALNPFGRIPVLIHGNVTLFETMANCRYVNDAFDGPPIVPEDTLTAAVMEQWASALISSVDRNLIRRFVVQYAFPSGPDGAPDRVTIDAALPDVAADLARIDAALAQTTYLAGDTPTIADFILLPMIGYVAVMAEGPDLMSNAPNLARFLDTFAKRPSYAATLPERLRKA
jgi:glutathione S-transferase